MLATASCLPLGSAAGHLHAPPLATAARAAREQASSKHSAFREEQMPCQPFTTNKEAGCVYFSLAPSPSSGLAPALFRARRAWSVGEISDISSNSV